MKNLLKTIFLSAAALVMLAGCSGFGSSDATVDAQGLSEGMCWLSISINNLDSIEPVKGRAARTINPYGYNELDDSNNSLYDGPQIASYKLTGYSVTTTSDLNGGAGIEIPVGTGGFSENATTHKQEAQVQIPYGSWELTLQALDASTPDPKVLFIGKTFADLKAAGSSAEFTLTTEGVDTAGAVDLSGDVTDSQGVAKSYSAGLYNTYTGALVDGTTLKKADVGAGGAISFTNNNLAPGRYSFQVRCYNDVATNITDENIANKTIKQVGYWEDVVVVAPARTTSYSGISVAINQKPAAPTDLRAFFKKNSDSESFYEVILTWVDNSNNEENYVINVDEYDTPTATTSTPYRILGVETNATDKKEPFFASDMNAGGTVRASSTTATIRLPYGRIFDVTIQAQNYLGLSDSDTSITGDQPCKRSVTLGTVPDGCDTDAQYYKTNGKINRLKITYNLDGGKLNVPAVEAQAATTNTPAIPAKAAVVDKLGSYTEYKNICDITNTKLPTVLLPIVANDQTGAHLTHNTFGYPFLKWAKADGSDFATAAPWDNLTCAGIGVKAIYNTSKTLIASVNDTYETISASLKNGTASDAAAIAVNGTGTIAKTAIADGFVFTVTPPTGMTVQNVSVKISDVNTTNNMVESGSIGGATWTYADANTLSAGEHHIVVTATLSDTKTYAFNFNLTITQ